MPEAAAFLPDPASDRIGRQYGGVASGEATAEWPMSDPLVGAGRRYTDAHPGSNPLLTAIDGVAIVRSDHEKGPSHLIFRPALCVVVQGAKWSVFGDRRFDYRAGQALVV